MKNCWVFLLLISLTACNPFFKESESVIADPAGNNNGSGGGNSNTVELNFSSSTGLTSDPNIEFLPTGAHIAANPTPVDGTLDSAPEYANGVASNTSYASGITLNNVPTSALGPTTTPQWASLVGYFTFDSTITGASKGSLSMTTSNAYVHGFSKVAGNSSADLYDSKGFISINDHSDIDFTDEFTVSFWLNRVYFFQFNSRLLMKGNSSNASPYTLLYNYCTGSTGSISLVLNGSTIITTACIDFTKPWSHIAVTYKKSLTSSQAKIYLDGEVIGAGNYSTTLNTNNMPLVFSGGEAGSAGGYKVGIMMDELMLWNTGLSVDEIKYVFVKQKSNYGEYTSKVINYGATKTHSTFSWVTDLPYGKELPADRVSEKTSDYSALVGSTSSLNDDNLLSNLELYYDFNGTLGSVTAETTITDKSGFARNFTTSANTIRAKTRFREGLQGLQSMSNISMLAPMSFSVWVAPRLNTSNNIFNNRISGNQVSINMSQFTSSNTINFIVNTASNTDTNLTCTNIKTAKDGMIHIAATFDATSLKLYINGNLCQSATGRNNTFSTTTFTSQLGLDMGLMDEFAIWRRELQAAEVMQLYKRGSSTAKFQVRSCDDPLCSGESWMGPDGTSNTFFSELYNVDDGFPAGLLSASSKTLDTKPVMTFADFPSSPADNQYFQWRAILESFVEEANCDGVFCKPLIQSVATADTVLPYPVGSYYVQNAASIRFSKIKYLVVTEGMEAGCTYRYRLSNNGGASFLYYNGSSWVASASDTDASNIIQVMSRISSFPTGGGEFVIRSIIQSNGTSDCSIKSITVERED